ELLAILRKDGVVRAGARPEHDLDLAGVHAGRMLVLLRAPGAARRRDDLGRGAERVLDRDLQGVALGLLLDGGLHRWPSVEAAVTPLVGGPDTDLSDVADQDRHAPADGDDSAGQVLDGVDTGPATDQVLLVRALEHAAAARRGGGGARPVGVPP